MQIVRKNSFQTSRWKNGGGITHEIARSDTEEIFGWRMSVAEVKSDGPFSLFPHHHRILTVIEGEGMDLLGAAASYHANHLVPVRFLGDEQIMGKLASRPCRDFNLIFDPLRYSAKIAVEHGKQKISNCFAVYMVSGGVADMRAGDMALLQDSNDFVQLGDGAQALVISLNTISK